MTLKLFIPCFMDQCAPQVGEAVAAILDRLGVPWDYPPDQTCCGQFAFTLGDLTTARRLARHFLQVFAEGEVLIPSASCVYLVRRQFPQLAADLKERLAMEELASRVWELSEWLAGSPPLPWTPRFPGSLALHESCKARQLGVLPGAAQALGRVQGLELLTISPYYKCCGFGGAFSVQQPELSRLMGEAYLEAVRATGAQGLVSLDLSCLLHLQPLAAARGWDLDFFHMAQILLRG